MVAIARGMMADPKLLMFDEPSLGLSPILVQQMFDIVRDITNHGVTVLLVEQNVFKTLRLADRGYVLENGAIVMTRSEEHTSELQSLMRISYAGFCLKQRNEIERLMYIFNAFT